MDGSLKNKTMIVTGASSGSGAAAAKRFATEGGKLASCALGRGIEDVGGRTRFELHRPRHCLTKPSDVATMVKATADRFGPIDILFANAGSYVAGDVASGDPEEWDRVVDINVSRGPRGAAGHDGPPLGRHRPHLVDCWPSGDPLGADLFGDRARGAVLCAWRAPASRQTQCARGIDGARNGSERAFGPDRSGRDRPSG